MRVIIQAVPERADYIKSVMLPSIQRAIATAKVEIAYDYDHNGPLWNAARIWRDAAQGAAPCLVLQDDVVIHKDAGFAIAQIVTHIEAGAMQAVSLFAPPRKVMDESLQAGYNFAATFDFLWSQGLILTPKFCQGLVDFSAGMTTKHDDSVVQAYSKASGIPVYTCLPSLVQHDLNVKSAMGTATVVAGTQRRSRAWLQNITHGHFATINAKRIGKPN